MHDPGWCHGLLRVVGDTLQRLRWTEDQFHQELDESQTTWNDLASREIYTRYLDIFRLHAAQGQQRLADQSIQLFEVVARMAEAEAPSQSIVQLSDEAQQHFREVDRDVEQAHHLVDSALDEVEQAMQIARSAQAIIASI